jgi:HSP20 family protein
MTTLVHRDGTTLLGELMNWMGAPTTGPEIRVEEYLDNGRRVIRADLPGVDPDKDITLTIEGDVLRLRGERRAEKHDEHRTEIRYGSFERVLPVPFGTKPEDLTAEYADGVLTVSLPVDGSPTSVAVPVRHRETPVE